MDCKVSRCFYTDRKGTVFPDCAALFFPLINQHGAVIKAVIVFADAFG